MRFFRLFVILCKNFRLSSVKKERKIWLLPLFFFLATKNMRQMKHTSQAVHILHFSKLRNPPPPIFHILWQKSHFSAIFWRNLRFPPILCQNACFFRDPLRKFILFCDPLRKFMLFCDPLTKCKLFLNNFDEVFFFSFSAMFYLNSSFFRNLLSKIAIFYWRNKRLFRSLLTEVIFFSLLLYKICAFFAAFHGICVFFSDSLPKFILFN